MRNKKVKQLKKEWLKLNESKNIKYDINSQIVKGVSFRQYKKLHS